MQIFIKLFLSQRFDSRIKKQTQKSSLRRSKFSYNCERFTKLRIFEKQPFCDAKYKTFFMWNARDIQNKEHET